MNPSRTSMTLNPIKLIDELKSQSIMMARVSCFSKNDSTIGLRINVSMAVTTMMKRSCTGVHLATASISEVAQFPRLPERELVCVTADIGGFLEAINLRVKAVASRIWPRLLPVLAAKMYFKQRIANTL